MQHLDQEIEAIRACVDILSPLKPEQARRVAAYLQQLFPEPNAPLTLRYGAPDAAAGTSLGTITVRDKGPYTAPKPPKGQSTSSSGTRLSGELAADGTRRPGRPRTGITLRPRRPANPDSELYLTLTELSGAGKVKTDIQWLLIYAFYSSEQGKRSFSRADILRILGENPVTGPYFKKNLSNSFRGALKHNLIAPTVNGYQLSQPGLELIEKILQGKAPKLLT